MTNFFITGLPRSRTAWMATFISTHPHVHCYHEGLKGCHSKEAFMNRMRPVPLDEIEQGRDDLLVGNSDSGLPLTNFQDMFPGAPIVVIWRDFDEVAAAVTKLFGSMTPAMREILDRTIVGMGKLVGLHVDYNQLDARMVDICHHIGIEYDMKQHQFLRQFNIQTMDLAPDQAALDIWT